MFKKTLLGIFACIFAIGIVISLIGFAMGGRYGSFGIENGNLTYNSWNQRHGIAHLPRWLGWNIGNWGWQSNHPNKPGIMGNAVAPAEIDFEALSNINVNIAAGFVTVMSGEKMGLWVNGDLPYTSRFENGQWTIEAIHNNITTRNTGKNIRSTRFYLNGKDVTTEFTLVLPKELLEMNLTVGVGTLDIQDFILDNASFSIDLGISTVRNIEAKHISLHADLGEIEAHDIAAEICELDVNLGHITFKGNATKEINANCELGSITITVPRPAVYGFETECELGKITIDGKKQNNASQGSNDANQPFFNLTCDLGSIDLIFH